MKCEDCGKELVTDEIQVVLDEAERIAEWRRLGPRVESVNILAAAVDAYLASRQVTT